MTRPLTANKERLTDMPRDPEQQDATGMDYPEYFQRFMGACRLKHQPRKSGLIDQIKTALKPSRLGAINPRKGRNYRVPESAELPDFFIRLDPWEAEYLFMLASRAKRGIAETGRLRGGSTFLMACANPHVPIHSIDIAPKGDEQLQKFFERFGVGENVELIVGDSQRGDYPSIKEIDLLFIDADHSFEGCTADLENWFPKVVTGGHIVLHDCYFESPVQPAVIAFMERHDVEVIQSPYIGASHWRNPTGSLAHLRKRG